MNWEDRLIELYICVEDNYNNKLESKFQRFSNNDKQTFTDVETIVVYLFGIMNKRKEITEIYRFTKNHLHSYFPNIPSYQNFNRRLNNLNDTLAEFTSIFLQLTPNKGVNEMIKLIDSMPIVMANAKRSNKAKVAPEFANKGYCSSKSMFYYGVKLHVIAKQRYGSLPIAEHIGLSHASVHDKTIFESFAQKLMDAEVYADLAYIDKELHKYLAEEHNLHIRTPIKREKGQKKLTPVERKYSKAVSRVRQPIESFFNWINEKTGIQMASKVRSHQGLLVHVFGRMAAAVYMLAFNL